MTALLINALLILIGFAIGIKFADIDLAPVLRLRHRSIWTHGPFIVYLGMYLIPGAWWLHWLMVGFLPAHALHLLADMFPRNWQGGAMVKIDPIKRDLAPILSFAWLGWSAWVSAHHWLQITGSAWGLINF
jgi:hypothetical protein